MNGKKLPQRVVWSISIMLLLVGCSAPAATPTPEPSPETVVEVGDVIFDGEACTFTCPTELSPGKYSFVYKDLSGVNAGFAIRRLADGKTFQDLLDMQSEPGEYFPKPDWVIPAVEPGSAWLKPDGGEVHTYNLTKEAEYAIVLWNSTSNIWFCAPFWVVEATSD